MSVAARYATQSPMQMPPDARRANTSRPLAAPPTQPPAMQPTGGPRSHPLATGAPRSHPLGTGAPPSQPQQAPLSQPQRLQLSGLIDDRIRGVTARDRQRAWLVNTVVLAQALITLMVVPGYLLPSPNLPILLTLGVALVFYLAAFIFNRWRRELRVAVYMLIGGGALATTAQVFVTAVLTSSSEHTAQSALLFLPIILEAGLFLTPELTLLVASAAAIVTASAILLALALSAESSNLLSQAYLVMVYTLGLETFIGYLAWRLAQFIYETVKSAQADEDLRFTQARLSAAQRQMNEQRRQLIQDVAAIQMAVSNVLANQYDTFIEPPEGDLAPLAQSLNLVIQQLRSTNELERRLRKTESEVPTIVESLGRLTTGVAVTQPSDTPTDSSLFAVRAALSQAHAVLARRQARLQEAAAQIADQVRHGREGLATAMNESTQSQQIAGKLVALVESLQETAKRQTEMLAQARRSLALVLPPELTRETAGQLTGGPGDLAGLSDDLGIRHIYTSELPILGSEGPEAIGIQPLGALTPSGEMPAAIPAAEASDTEASGEFSASLADAWLLLHQLHTQTVAEMRAVSDITHDVGVLSKYVRKGGMELDWLNHSIDTIDRINNQMQQLASLSGAGVEADESGVSGMARTGALSTPRRGPLPTRPLAPDARLATEPDGQPASQTDDAGMAAPGSLSIADLIGSGTFGPADRPADQPEAQSDPNTEPGLDSPHMP